MTKKKNRADKNIPVFIDPTSEKKYKTSSDIISDALDAGIKEDIISFVLFMELQRIGNPIDLKDVVKMVNDEKKSKG